MSQDLQERLGALAEELRQALAAGEALDIAALAERFGVSEEEAKHCAVALRAMEFSLGEDLGLDGDMDPPDLPEDYEVRRELGRGGMGIVYHVHQKSLDRDVALKVLRPGDLWFGDAISRFESEARSLARLRHRHIVSVHEVGRVGSFVYFTMDLVEGKTLQELIADRRMTVSRAIRLTRQVASGIAFAHGQGIVHRDLKPANILVDGEGDAFVVDFGLARDAAVSTNKTATGQLLGTPAYMSPEQALGDRARIGEASDIYALGAVLYECLAGKAPFAGKPLAQLLKAVIEEEPIPIRKLNPGVPRDLEVICLKAMAKRPEDRYPTVQAFAEDLERLATGQTILARRPSQVDRMVKFLRRHKRQVLTAVCTAALVLCLAWFFVYPKLLRAFQLSQADRHAAREDDSAAVMAYQDVLTGEDPESIDLALRARYARVLVNEAARLRLRGGADAEKQALEHLAESRRILEPGRRGHGYFWRGSQGRTAVLDANYERLRMSAVEAVYFEVHMPVDDLALRVQRDLTGSGRAAALMLISQWVVDLRMEAPDLGKTGRDALLEILRLHRKMPPELREALVRSLTQMAFDVPFPGDWDSDFESALMDLVRDDRFDLEVRKVAAAFFHNVGSFPFCYETRRQEYGSNFSTLFVVRDADLRPLVDFWDSLRGLPRLEACRRRVEFVARSLFSGRRRLKDDGKSLHGWDLRHWLHDHTGISFNSESQWNTWWNLLGKEDPRLWLLRAMQWEIEPAALTPSILLNRFRTEIGSKNGIDTSWVHHLLALTVDENVAVPRIHRSKHHGILLVRWEKALGCVPTSRHHIRLATMAFVNGDPRPHLVWQKRVELGIGEDARWRDPVLSDLGVRHTRLAFGRDRMASPAGKLTHSGSASLTWIGTGLKCQASLSASFYLLPRATSGGYSRNRHGFTPGRVGQLGHEYAHPPDWQWCVYFINMAVIESENDPECVWTYETWRRQLIRTVKDLDPADGFTEPDRHHIIDLLSFVPLPEAREALAAVAARSVQHHKPFSSPGRGCDSDWRRARLLAGDVRAVEHGPEEGGLDTAKHWDPIEPWLRVALSTGNSVIRDHAFEQMREKNIRPAFARTLLKASQNGTPLPAWLRDRIEGTSGMAAACLSRSWPSILGLVLLVLLNAAAVVGLWFSRRKPRWRRNWGKFFWLTTMVLAHVDVWIDGIQWNPLWFACTLNVLAIWMSCWRRVRGWFWVVLPLWWTGMMMFNPFGVIEGDALVWIVALVLFTALKVKARKQPGSLRPGAATS